MACECMHFVTRDHFRSRDKDDGHTVRSVIAENPRYTQTLWLYLLSKRSDGRSIFLHCRI